MIVNYKGILTLYYMTNSPIISIILLNCIIRYSLNQKSHYGSENVRLEVPVFPLPSFQVTSTKFLLVNVPSQSIPPALITNLPPQTEPLASPANVPPSSAVKLKAYDPSAPHPETLQFAPAVNSIAWTVNDVLEAAWSSSPLCWLRRPLALISSRSSSFSLTLLKNSSSICCFCSFNSYSFSAAFCSAVCPFLPPSSFLAAALALAISLF